MLELEDLLHLVRQLHDRMRQRVLEAAQSRSIEELSQVVGEDGGDTIFAIDRESERELLEYACRELACREPIVLIAEGLPGGKLVVPANADETDCRWRIIVDPIDGTRCLMFQKRSGWILTGVARNRGVQTSLQDIELAVQTEIPILKQNQCDQLWAMRGGGACAERYDLLSGESRSIPLQPTRASTIQYGFAAISRFFPGLRDVLAKIDDEVVTGVLGPRKPDSTMTFEDQYPSTGGQVFGLASGADRFLADLRPLMRKLAVERGENLGHCCHPYDICTMLIAEEAGATITDARGAQLDVPLDVETDVAWIGYANDAIRAQVESVLLGVLKARGLVN